MEDIIDLIATGASPNQISLTIKDTIFSKAAERIDSFKPYVAASMFETEDEIDQEVETSTEEE
jgi:hypothetical protein